MSDRNIGTFLKDKTSELIVPAIMFIIGLIAFFSPGRVLNIVGYIVGSLLLLGAFILGVSGYQKQRMGSLIVGVICGVIAILFLVNPGGRILFLLKILGFIIIVNSIMGILEIRASKSGLSGSWIRYAIFEIVSAAVGAFLFFVTEDTTGTIISVLGVLLIISGITNAISAYKAYKYGRPVNDGNVVWEE